MRIFKSIPLLLFLALSMLAASDTRAQSLSSFSAPAAHWVIQDTIPQGILVSFTPSSCIYGRLYLPSTAVSEDRNMLMAVIATSKATGIPVLIYYTEVSGNCVIYSFGL